MESETHYWQLVRLDGTGRCRVGSIAIAEAFFQKFLAAADDLSPAQLHLGLVQSRLEPAHADAADLCLRCYISHQIQQVCLRLEHQFGQQHGFSRTDLLPLVLHDDGTPRSAQPTNAAFQSLACAIVDSFDPQKASLNTWVLRQVRHHPDLSAFLLEQGVYLITDWAILNDTTPAQVQRILSEFCSLSAAETQQAAQLLHSYHAVYRHDRLQDRIRGVLNRSSCRPPTPEQLHRMADYLGTAAPPTLANQRLISQLQALANRLRQYRIYIRTKRLPVDSLDQPQLQRLVPTIGSSSDSTETDEFLSFYRSQLQRCLDQGIQQVTRDRLDYLESQNPPMADPFLQALQLFHCRGEPMAKIAPLVGLKAQYQVTRLMKLKEFRADVQQRWFAALRDRVTDRAKEFAEGDRPPNLNQRIEAALFDEITTLMQQAAAEAAVNQDHRPPPSLFARRLCLYLDTLSASCRHD
jgi:hypothetical protein